MPRFTRISKFRLLALAIVCIISLTTLVWPAASLWVGFSQSKDADSSRIETPTDALSKQQRPNLLTRLLAPDSRATFNHKGNGTSLLRSPLEATAILLVPTITATKVDSIITDVDGDGRVDPGDTIQYTVTINNAGTDATAMKFTDPLDTNLTLVGGSVNTTPIAFDDTAYTATGNVRITVSAANGVLVNDIDPDTLNNTGLTASAGATSANGGNVVMAADGSFSYNPPAGFTGSDTFTYTVTDGAGATGTGTVSFNVSGMIWFVQTGAAAGGNGRLTNPFNCLVGAGCFDAVAADDPGDNIFLYSGAYTGGLTLLANQRLIGQGAGASLSTITGLTPPAGSDALPATGGARPTITTTAAATSAITVGSGNTLRGFDIGNTTAVDITGTGIGTLTISEMTLNGTGRPLNLTTGTLAATIDNLQATTAPGGPGVSLTGIGGTLTISGTTSITTAGGAGITIGGSSVAVNFGTSTTITDPTAQGILVSTSTGNISFGNTTVSDATDSISLISNSAGTRSFGTITTTNGTGNGFLHSTAGGLVTVSGTTTITNPGGRGIDIQDSTTTITFANVTATQSGGTGVFIDDTSAAVTFADLDISPDAAQRGLNVTDQTGTLTTTSGVITSTTTGIPVEIVGTSAASRTPLAMVLETVNANGAANGIVLTNTSGTFAVNGTGTTAGSGGVIQNITNRGASFIDANGITLKNINFTNVGTTNGADPNNSLSTCGSLANTQGGNAGCNAGIHMNGVVGATFDRLVLNGGVQQGINGNNVTTFALSNSSVLNFGNETRESGIQFRDLKGTNTISNTTATGNEESQLKVVGTNGTLNSLTVTGGSYGTSAAPFGTDGITFQGTGTANMTISVSGATLSNNAADGFFSTATDTSVTDTTVSGCTIQNNLNAGVNINIVSGANGSFDVLNNTLTNMAGNVINLNVGGPSTGTLQGTVSGNIIGTAGVSGSGSPGGGSGIRLVTNGSGNAHAIISNNTVRGILLGSGIDVLARDGSSDINATITGNNIDLITTTGGNGISVQSGATSTDTTSVCADIGGSTVALRNTITNQPVTALDELRIRNRFAGTTFRLPGYAGGGADIAAVVAYLQGRNAVAAGGTTSATVNANTFGGGGACTQPARMADRDFSGALAPATDAKDANPALTADVLDNILSSDMLTASAWQPSLMFNDASLKSIPAPVQEHTNTLAASSSNTGGTFLNHVSKTTTRPASEMLADVHRSAQDEKLRKPVQAENETKDQPDRGEGPDGGGTVTVGGVPGFTLPAGKTVTIRFRVTVDTGVLPAFTTVSNQGTVSGSNFADVVTDDSDVAGANQPTVTNIDHTTVAISSNANPSVFGQNVTFTATMTGVPSRASDPPGTVQFKADGNNIGAAVPIVVGTAGDNVSTAQASISSLSVGSHVITAEYSGGGAGALRYNANIGTLAGNQVVGKSNTASAILTDTPDPSLTGQTVTVTFTVTPTGGGAGTPTGDVTVSDGVDSCTATAAVGSCTLTLSTAGVRNLTATYVGDGNFNASPASPAATHTVTTTATWVGGTSSDWDTDTNWGTGRKPNLPSHSANIPAAGVTNEPTISLSDVTLTDLTVGAGRTLTVSGGRILTVTGATMLSGSIINPGGLTFNALAINNAAGVSITGDASVSGVLTLTSGNLTTSGTLSVGGSGSITRTAGHIIGNLKKTFAAPGSFTYHVGTANGYSPLATTVTAGTGDLTVKANQGTAPPLPAATTLQRYWTLTEAGSLTANLTFNYLQTDVAGNEANYRIIRVEGGSPVSIPNNCPTGPCVNPATNTAIINGVMNFSEWTLGEQLLPTAAEADISGQVVFVGGRPMRGVTVSLLNLTTSEVMVTRTDAKGRYRFTAIATGTDYLVSVMKEGYGFNPPSLLFTHTNAVAGVNFEATIWTPVGDDGIQKMMPKEGENQEGKPISSDLAPPGKP